MFVIRRRSRLVWHRSVSRKGERGKGRRKEGGGGKRGGFN